MNKKFLSLVLALVMVLGTFSSVFAAKPAEKKEAKEAPKATEKVVPKLTGKTAKLQWLQDKGIVEGRKVNEDPKNNDLALDKNIQRAEVSKLLVFATDKQGKVDALKGITIYKDVALNHWANGYINVGSTEKSDANGIPFLLGYPGNVFKPANDVTYAELAKMLVTLTKTDLTKDMHDKANANWPAQWMAWAAELGIFEDVDVKDANKAVNRADAFTMLYNAKYRLQDINKLPAGETRGIISQIKNGEITINQGEKAKTVKLTANTTFVLYKGQPNVNSVRDLKAIRASVLSNPSYYYGSFVRVLVNDKGEATHVLELGNPADLAIGNSNDDKDNVRWADVAERTVETKDAVYDKTGRTVVSPAIQALVNYDKGDAKSIQFFGGVYSKVLNLTAATKYYVADAEKNQLTEVKDVDEALRIVGNTDAAGALRNVYAGYNVIGDSEKHVTRPATHVAGYNEATVVVFNKVQKDNNNARLLRVKNNATSLYDITFENVKGEVVLTNVKDYRGAFPMNFKDAKLNVVEYTENAANSIGIKVIIKHTDTEKFPIVKVVDVFNNGRSVVVQDKNNHTATLTLTSDADIFCAEGLKVGDVIQFHTLADNALVNDADKTNMVDVVSIMPHGVALDGALQFVTEYNQSNQRYAEGVKASDVKTTLTNGYRQVTVNEYMYLYNKMVGTEKTVAWLIADDANLLEAYINAKGAPVDISYKIGKADKLTNLVAYDVEVLVKEGGVDKWVDLNKAVALEKAAQQKALDDFNKEVAKVPNAKAGYTFDTTDKTKADKQVADAVAKVEKLKADFKALNVNLLKEADVDAARDAVNKAIDALNDAVTDAKTAGTITGVDAIDKLVK